MDEVDERKMLKVMAGAYNEARTERDFEKLVLKFDPAKAKGRKPGQSWESVYDSLWDIRKLEYSPAMFPDQITREDVVDALPWYVDGEFRKGGFQLQKGIQLNSMTAAKARDYKPGGPVKVNRPEG